MPVSLVGDDSVTACSKGTESSPTRWMQYCEKNLRPFTWLYGTRVLKCRPRIIIQTPWKIRLTEVGSQKIFELRRSKIYIGLMEFGRELTINSMKGGFRLREGRLSEVRLHNQQRLETVKEFKYSGIVFSYNGLWKKHNKESTKKHKESTYGCIASHETVL